MLDERDALEMMEDIGTATRQHVAAQVAPLQEKIDALEAALATAAERLAALEAPCKTGLAK